MASEIVPRSELSTNFKGGGNADSMVYPVWNYLLTNHIKRDGRFTGPGRYLREPT